MADVLTVRRRWTALAVLTLLLAVAVVVVTSVVAGAWPYRVLGTADPGPVVRVAAPLVRLVVDVAALVCTGSAVFAAFFTKPDPTGLIAPAAYASLRTAGRAAFVWAVAALVEWPLDAAATAGLPLRTVLTPAGLSGLTGALESSKAWLVTAATAGVVAVVAPRVLRWQPSVAVAGLAVFAVLPPLAVGHSASDTGHDIATAAIMIHVPAAVIWLGVLVALLRARGVGRFTAAIARRYRRLSSVCWLVVAMSGLVDAAVMAPGTDIVTTGYGLVVLAKAGVVIVLALLIGRMRRAAIVSGPRRARLLAVELIALAMAFGASVGLTDLPAPKFVGHEVTGDQTLLGYNLFLRPTLARLVFDWRVEVFFTALVVALVAGYAWGLRRLRRSGAAWPVQRTVAWMIGCVVLLVATSSGIARYAPAMFSVQAVAHMLVGMLAPIGLALGAPLTLAESALAPAGSDDLPGPVEWLLALRDSAVVRIGTHPLIGTAIFVGAPFLLYFTEAFDVTVRFHWAHMAMDAIFLVIGYLFAWMIIGPDPVPRPVPNLMRLGLLLAVMPADVLFTAAIVANRHIIGNGNAGANMYTALGLPWVHSLAADQRLGGYLALAVSEVSLLVMLAVLARRWAGDDDLGGDYTAIIDAVARRATTVYSDPATAVGPDRPTRRRDESRPQAVPEDQQ